MAATDGAGYDDYCEEEDQAGDYCCDGLFGRKCDQYVRRKQRGRACRELTIVVAFGLSASRRRAIIWEATDTALALRLGRGRYGCPDTGMDTRKRGPGISSTSCSSRRAGGR